MKSYSLRRAFRGRLASLANLLTIRVGSSDASAPRYVFHPMGVVRIPTPDEESALSRDARPSARG